MIILIERISKITAKRDLIDFIQPALKGHLFQKAGQLGYAKVVTHTEQRTGAIKYYGMILIPSDIAAERVIKRLNKKVLLDELVIIRKYYSRSWRNDPRINDKEFIEELDSMRKGERRVSTLEEEKVEVKKEIVKFAVQKNLSPSNLTK